MDSRNIMLNTGVHKLQFQKRAREAQSQYQEADVLLPREEQGRLHRGRNRKTLSDANDLTLN